MLGAAMLMLAGGLAPSPVSGGNGQWADIEIMGLRSLTRQAVLKQLDIAPGTPIEWSARRARSCAQRLEEALELAGARCQKVPIDGEGTYLVVDVVEPAHADRLNFAPSPGGDVTLPEALREQRARLQARLTELDDAGDGLRLSSGEHYPHYDDARAQAISQRLHELSKAHRGELFTTLYRAPKPQARALAVELLSWAGSIEDSVRRIHISLDDPSSRVRHSIGEFLARHLDRAPPGIARSAVPSLCRQLGRPSHGDRSAALGALTTIAARGPAQARWVAQQCRGRIARIAERSVIGSLSARAEGLLGRFPDGQAP